LVIGNLYFHYSLLTTHYSLLAEKRDKPSRASYNLRIILDRDGAILWYMLDGEEQKNPLNP
jgi:hypothetical protein